MGAEGELLLYHQSKNQIPRLFLPDHPDFKPTKITGLVEDTLSKQIYVRGDGMTGVGCYNRLTKSWRIVHFAGNKNRVLGGTVLKNTRRGVLAIDNRKLFLLSPGDKQFKPLSINLPENAGFITAFSASNGDVFLAGLHGYLIWLDESLNLKKIYRGEDLKTPTPDFFTKVNVLASDTQGRVWLSTYKGFSIFSPESGTFQHFSTWGEDYQGFKEIRSMQHDTHGRMWFIGIDRFGCLSADKPEIGLSYKKELLGQTLLWGVLDVGRNDLWYVCGDDLHRFNTKTFDVSKYKGFKTETPYILSRNELAFANAAGIGLINPDSLKSNRELARAYISWFKVFDQEWDLTGTLFAPDPINLKPKENFFSIGFSALGFFLAENFRFAYKLEGFDPEWVYPNRDQRVASYTGVKGGDYTFRLKVANSDGVWGRTDFSWRIHVGTPWWATWWFRVLIVGLIAAFVYFLFKNRLRQQQILLENQRLQLEREHALRRERDRIASEMHDDLGTGLSIIRLLSLAAKSHERDPVKSARIDKIAQSAANMMEKMADIIWVMNSRNDSLENFAAYLRRYAAEYLDMHGIRFRFEMPAAMPNLSLSGEQRRGLLLAVKECLHNVAKHAGATEAKLEILFNGHLSITLTDNGKGIPESLLQRFREGDQTLIGNGLYNLRQRVEALGGTLLLENQNGAKVVLQTGIPLPA